KDARQLRREHGSRHVGGSRGLLACWQRRQHQRERMRREQRMTNLEIQIALWHENRFGKAVNMPATYRKLMEEVGELGEALMRQDPEAIREESGDVAFVLAHILRAACPDHPSLHTAMGLALDKCERRLHKEQPAQS